jgi:hypothetical protein
MMVWSDVRGCYVAGSPQGDGSTFSTIEVRGGQDFIVSYHRALPRHAVGVEPHPSYGRL